MVETALQTGVIRRHIPNLISLSRLGLGAIGLPYTRPFSTSFWGAYAAIGVSDIADGFLARRWNVTSTAGSVLDSTADLVVAHYYWRTLLPRLPLPDTYTRWAEGIMASKVAVGTANVVRGNAVNYHHDANRLTGLIAYLVPTLRRHPIACSTAATVACLSASISVVLEARILRGR